MAHVRACVRVCTLMNTHELNPFPKEVIKMRDGWTGRFFSVISQADKAALKCSLLFQDEFITLQLVWARQAVQRVAHAASPAPVACSLSPILNDQGDLQRGCRMKTKCAWFSVYLRPFIPTTFCCTASSTKLRWCLPGGFVTKSYKTTLKNKEKPLLVPRCEVW